MTLNIVIVNLKNRMTHNLIHPQFSHKSFPFFENKNQLCLVQLMRLVKCGSFSGLDSVENIDEGCLREDLLLIMNWY